MIGEIITGASNVLGGLISAFSHKSAGDQAAQIQRETNAQQIELANTAHQREIKDLKAAGLNPLLSGTGGQGSHTPTLTAPTQSSTGSAKAGAELGNMMSILPTAIMQYMTGQQQIELTKAQAMRTREETENIREQRPWIQPKALMNITEGQQRVVESTQRTLESKARTATTEAMREPEIQRILAQTAQLAQQTKTEEQRTREATEAANNAKQLFGSRAAEAATIAAQAATYYKNYFQTEQTQKIDQRDLEIELLRNENFLKLIQGILDNEYGHLERWSTIMNNPMKAGATAAAQTSGGKGNVTKTNPYNR